MPDTGWPLLQRHVLARKWGLPKYKKISGPPNGEVCTLFPRPRVHAKPANKHEKPRVNNRWLPAAWLYHPQKTRQCTSRRYGDPERTGPQGALPVLKAAPSPDSLSFRPPQGRLGGGSVGIGLLRLGVRGTGTLPATDARYQEENQLPGVTAAMIGGRVEKTGRRPWGFIWW